MTTAKTTHRQPAPRPASIPRALTSRESEVLTLIANGRTNREIAGELYLSPNTVKTYIRTAYRTIGVERRTQATVWWWSHHGEPQRHLRAVETTLERVTVTGAGTDRSATPGPVCVAALSRSEVTRAGVRTLLARFPDRVTFVDHHLDGPSPEVGVAIFELTRGDLADLTALAELTAEPLAVVVMVSPFRRDLTARCLALGAHAWVSTDITGPELVGVVEATWARVAHHGVTAADAAVVPRARGGR